MRAHIHSRVLITTWCATLLLVSCAASEAAQSEPNVVQGIASEQAAAVGVNYEDVLVRAFSADPSAVAKFLDLTPSMDGAGATFHSARLRKLLGKLGDINFSNALRHRSLRVRRAVADSLDYAFEVTENRHDWAHQYPSTYNVGQHRKLR